MIRTRRGPRRLLQFAILIALRAGGTHADTGSQVCAGCHAEIYRSYQKTGMARSSGRAATIAKEGKWTDARSGVQYEVYRQGASAYFSFDVPGVHGSRPLEYFIGSGDTGRGYLFRMDGFLYEAPVSWYSARGAWDLSPGYSQYDSLFLTRGVQPACLRCHASGLRPVAGTTNGFETPPFAEDGVSCERCHGPGEEHARKGGAIVNPAKLQAARRDDVCAQCHLSGQARITRAGAEGRFQPGQPLHDSEVVFLRDSGAPDLTVTSHFERLVQSACKRASGDRLWCGSCHDVHRTPEASAYQAQCRGCHQERQCARGPDCTGCHMPKSAVRDVPHATYTDHWIRRPGTPPDAPPGPVGGLKPFGGAEAGDREFGLAYAATPGFEKRAIEYLERAPPDAGVLANLAYLYDTGGNEARAIPLYQRALELDPMQVTAAVNLAIARWRRGEAQEAIRLWQHALQRSPGLENARMSLAVAQYRTGDTRGAEASLGKLLELNPTAKDARSLWNQIRTKRGER